MLTNTDNEVGIQENNEILIKSQEYIKTKRMRNMECATNSYDDSINFEIKKGEPILLWHIMSLLFYTDFTELSTSFSKTFLRMEAGESLKSVKERNSFYWWLSKYIIEAVNCYVNDGFV